jgi:hypothetical protein
MYLMAKEIFNNKNMAKQIKKNSSAGRKPGRKPVEDKKVVVNLFIRQSELDKRGGKEEVQKQCYDSVQRSAALCLFATCTRFQVTTNVYGANSTKPLLPAGAVYLAGF